MDSEKKDRIWEFLKKLGKIPDKNLNEKQKEFIDLYDEGDLDLRTINKFFQEKDNYPDGLKNKKIEEISQAEWDSAIKELFDGSGDKEDEKAKKEAPSILDDKNIIYYDVVFDKEAKDIGIKLRKPKNPVPTDIFKFIKSVDTVQHAINEIYSLDFERNFYLKSLSGIARVGGTSTYIELAKLQLEQFKQEMVLQKGSEIRLTYIRQLGYAGMGVTILCLVALLLHSTLNIVYKHEYIFMNGCFMLIGSSIGTWLSFGIRKKEILFEDLRLLTGNKKDPMIRMIILVLIALSFYFMFITNFLNINIGDTFDTSNIGEKGYESMAFLVGIFLGLAENTIGPSLTNRVETFTSKL